MPYAATCLQGMCSQVFPLVLIAQLSFHRLGPYTYYENRRICQSVILLNCGMFFLKFMHKILLWNTMSVGFPIHTDFAMFFIAFID